MTKRQLLWKVELPLAMPEIIAGVRIATVSTVAIATLAIFAGAGGLGEIIYNQGIQRDVFKTNIVSRQRPRGRAWRSSSTACSCSPSGYVSPWRQGADAVSRARAFPSPFLGSFGGAIDFIFSQRDLGAGRQQPMVGGLDQIWELLRSAARDQRRRAALAIAIALPIGL